MQVVTPKLSVKARQGPSPDGFVHKSSRVEGFRLQPLFVHWNNGEIGDIYHIEGGELSVINIMKGIASLFQVIYQWYSLHQDDFLVLCWLETFR